MINLKSISPRLIRGSFSSTGVDIRPDDKILTLSTCNNAFDTARLVIVARRVRDGEDPNERIAGSIPNPNIKWPNVYYLWNEKTYNPDALLLLTVDAEGR